MGKKTYAGEMIQLSIFELFDVSVLQNQKQDKKESSDYLHREDRIISLAQEKYKRVLRSYQFSELEEKIYSIRITEKDTLTDLIGKIARVFRRFLSGFTLEKGKMLQKLIPYNISLTYADEATMFFPLSKKENDHILQLTLKEEGYPELHVYGHMKQTPSVRQANVLFIRKMHSHFGDLAKMLAWMFVLSRVNQAFKDSDDNWTDLFPGSLFSDKDSLKQRFDYGLRNRDDSTSLRTFFIHPSLQGSPVDQITQDLFPNGRIIYSESADLNAKNYVQINGYDNFLLTHPFMILKNIVPYHAFLITHKRATCLDYWPLPSCDKPRYSTGALQEVLKKAIAQIWTRQGNTILFIKELSDSRTEYAKSYQTKKNIPRPVLEAMQSSLFNKYFGYVEFDLDVDLSKVDEIRKEFSAFIETFFPGLDISDNALRIRKLGNHKASGLYYPGVKCLCIDIKSLSSMIHEFGHLLDYSYNAQKCLSLETDLGFNCIIRKYRECLLATCEENKAFAAKLKSNTKYNLNYFLKPTEVFARSFELYCKHTLGVCNSLLDPVGMEYPEDPNYLAMISDYFKKLFG